MGKDIYIDDFEAELLVSDTSFKPPKDKEEDDGPHVRKDEAKGDPPDPPGTDPPRQRSPRVRSARCRVRYP